MSTWQALDVAATGAGLGRAWLDTVAHNIANVNTVRPAGEEPFRAKLVVARPLGDGDGVAVTGIVEVGGEPPVTYDPSSPLAAADGAVTLPAVDLTAEMASLIAAQRTYQANLSVVRASRDAYEATFRMGAV